MEENKTYSWKEYIEDEYDRTINVTVAPVASI